MASDTASSRDQLVYKARLAEQAERYDEMACCMKTIAMLGVPLTLEERNLLSVAYKNSVGERRSAWRVVSAIESKQQETGEAFADLTAAYRETIEKELNSICSDVVELLHKYLLRDAQALPAESRVSYYKMLGDYYRYVAELSPTATIRNSDDSPKLQAEAAYQLGMNSASELLPVHPVRLGLALNFSVFYCEIMNDVEMACQMARQAFDEAVAGLDSASEETYRDAALIMQLLRDNLTLWTTDENPSANHDGSTILTEEEKGEGTKKEKAQL